MIKKRYPYPLRNKIQKLKKFGFKVSVESNPQLKKRRKFDPLSLSFLESFYSEISE